MSTAIREPSTDRAPTSQLDCSVVALTHYLPPYMARVLYHASQQIRDFRALLSIDQEPNRRFGNTWDGLNVQVQKSLMFRRPWKHSAGFEDELYVHLPYDTIRQLRRAKPDIVFSYELGFRSFNSAVYCKTHRKRLALCVCVSEHTEQGRGTARRLLRRILLSAADAVTYNGPSCRRYLARFHVPDEKLFHFPYCTSDLFRYEEPVDRPVEANHRLLCIGQLSARKGIMPMIDALTSYCKKRTNQIVHLDLVGTGPMEDALRAIQLPENFSLNLVGHLQYDEMSDAMSRAGVLLFPTLADEWGLVVNEAMQAGMPVIGSEYAQACTTLINEGENGWIYRPGDPRQLHSKLDQMYSTSNASISKMRSCAQQTVAHITSTSVADKLVTMFRSLVS